MKCDTRLDDILHEQVDATQTLLTFSVKGQRHFFVSGPQFTKLYSPRKNRSCQCHFSIVDCL